MPCDLVTAARAGMQDMLSGAVLDAEGAADTGEICMCGSAASFLRRSGKPEESAAKWHGGAVSTRWQDG